MPGQSLVINTPFRVKIPASFSRLGHVKQAYQITQWYPKPAVFDHKGWHPISYLDQGEFYSEFGSFDVKITLPSNYVVASTGNLKTISEELFLDSLANAKLDSSKIKFTPIGKTKAITPASTSTFKTLHYVQDSVHDFAWFADKRYHVLKGEVELENKNITSWALFTNSEAKLWKRSIEYINDATKYFSKWVYYRQFYGIFLLHQEFSFFYFVEFHFYNTLELSFF